MARLNVVTGATGLLGSHIAEQLRTRGERVRALVRPASDTTFLRHLGVELAAGDLTEPDSLRRAVADADVVYHCAARVGDWGPWRAFQREVIDATANLLDACRVAGVGRVLHVSSIIVYGHPRIRPECFTEDEPLGQDLWLWDYYCWAKVRAEELCRCYPGDLTIVRPSWIYGPRDRTTLPRVLKAMDANRVAILGNGDNLLNIIYASDVAEGAILAANHPRAKGQAYNLSSTGEITQHEFLDLLADSLGRPRIGRHVSYRLAFWGGFLSEVIGRIIRIRRPPHLTRYAVALIGRSTRFSTAKAREQLGWLPRVGIRDGVQRTLDWYKKASGGRQPPVG
ncbi:MAG TPA: NAD-dependent epimerase/dehydratase family protein [Gemmataceae bacterium]|jgi:nucleoside-diphosphate-sugar epimerase